MVRRAPWLFVKNGIFICRVRLISNSAILHSVSSMSSSSGTKKKPVSSTGRGDHSSHRDSAVNAAQHPSGDRHSQSIPDQRGREEGSTTKAGQYPSGDTHSHLARKPTLPPHPQDQQRRDEGYNQTYDTKSQGQRRPSVTSPEDGTNRHTPADLARHDDHGQRGANAGYGGSSRHNKDEYNGRSRPKEGRTLAETRLIRY